MNENNSICKNHGKPLQAFCQNDKIPVCLNCILTDHKAHKIVLVTEKVKQDKKLIRESLEGIIKSKQILAEKNKQCMQVMDRLSLDLKQFVFQINLMFKNIVSQLKQIEQSYISEVERSITNSIKQIKSIQQINSQKSRFYQQLAILYDQLMQKDQIQYLNDYNKRSFIMKNAIMKQKITVNYTKQQLNKQKFISQIIKQLQQLLIFQKKSTLIANNKQQINEYPFKNSIKKTKLQTNNSMIQAQSPSKNKKKQMSISQKKQMYVSQKINKEPQVLEVNLLQKYQKYQAQKNMKKRNSQYALSSNNSKSPKIQYEVKLDYQEDSKYKSNKIQNKNYKMQQSSSNKKSRKQSFDQHKFVKKTQFKKQQLINSNKQSIYQNIADRKNGAKHMRNQSNSQKQFENYNQWQCTSQYQKLNKSQLFLSFLNQSSHNYSPSQNKSHIKTLQIETPFSIKSFMESSQFTIKNQNQTMNRQQNLVNMMSEASPIAQYNIKNNYQSSKRQKQSLKLQNHQNSFMSRTQQDSLLKDSRASFSVFCTEQKIFHLGGLRNESIDCLKFQNKSAKNIITNNQTILKGILNRSKFQCVIVKSYSSKKLLILGGKDFNGQRCNSVLQFDTQKYKIQKTIFQLNQPISGFGAVVYENKIYVFGGSSSLALKTMLEYRIGKNGFQCKKLSSMINTRDELGFALGFDGYLYACGGINSSNVILNSCQRYCFKSNKWTSTPALKSPRRSFSLISLPNGIYAIGGHDGKSYLRSVQMYDYQLNKWIQVSAMNNARFTHSSVHTIDYQNIIVFGGFQNIPLKSSQIYNVIQNKWMQFESMPNQRYLHCSIICKQ